MKRKHWYRVPVVALVLLLLVIGILPASAARQDVLCRFYD